MIYGATYGVILVRVSLENGFPYISEHFINTYKIHVVSVNMSVKANAISIITVLDFFFNLKNMAQHIVLRIYPDSARNVTTPR